MAKEKTNVANQEAVLAFWMLAPAFAIVMAIVVFPMLWNIWLSLKPMSLGDLRGASLFKFNLTLKNYIDVVKDPEFGTLFLTTIIYSIFGSGLSILMGLAAALLVHGDFKGRSILRGLFIAPYIAPVVAVTFTWSFILDPQLGVLNWLAVDKGILL